MARTPQAAAPQLIETRQLPAAAALAALGVVYGDIGTSALYGFKQAADAAGTISPETTMGIVSVILWSLILIVSLKSVCSSSNAKARLSSAISSGRS